jgi:hypothetical protein
MQLGALARANIPAALTCVVTQMGSLSAAY